MGYAKRRKRDNKGRIINVGNSERRLIASFLSFWASLLVVMAIWNSAYADDGNGVEYHDTEIKVGLYFTDAQKNIYNAVSSFEIYAEKGLELGYKNGDEFVVLLKTGDKSVLTISKGELPAQDDDTQQNYDKKGIAVKSSISDAADVFGSENGIFQIRPNSTNDPYIFNLNGKNYRGFLEIRRLEGSDMTLINVLPLEEYLYGVVPCEMVWKSHPEALKAQAVVARTYAYGNMGKYAKLGFDVCNTVLSQVYKGYDVEKDTTNKAVDDTRDEMVYYNGAIAQVFYFSSSGGRTEAAKNVWSYDAPYLQSVEDKYESGESPNYNWEKLLDSTYISDRMISMGNNIGEISGVKISKKTDAGRALEMIITGTKGEVILEKSRCRDILGFPSQWFDIATDADVMILDHTGGKNPATRIQLAGKTVITSKGSSIIGTGKSVCLLAADGIKTEVPSTPEMYTFTGKGYGHAVGMSQEGAKGMAEAGFGYKEIISHYFAGTHVDY
ncbi:MAG: SpoIID/LytB domain-containing protein [Clostridiaceae bacterium]|nr:SpoIID/LytB domain-containing protein [Clostridiaceae bacterium]